MPRSRCGESVVDKCAMPAGHEAGPLSDMSGSFPIRVRSISDASSLRRMFGHRSAGIHSASVRMIAHGARSLRTADFGILAAPAKLSGAASSSLADEPHAETAPRRSCRRDRRESHPTDRDAARSYPSDRAEPGPEGNCSGHLRTLILASRNVARSHIGTAATRIIETMKTVEFMAGSTI